MLKNVFYFLLGGFVVSIGWLLGGLKVPSDTEFVTHKYLDSILQVDANDGIVFDAIRCRKLHVRDEHYIGENRYFGGITLWIDSGHPQLHMSAFPNGDSVYISAGGKTSYLSMSNGLKTESDKITLFVNPIESYIRINGREVASGKMKTNRPSIPSEPPVVLPKIEVVE
jgi:hypothetical protein